jgi:hypothetical protein
VLNTDLVRLFLVAYPLSPQCITHYILALKKIGYNGQSWENVSMNSNDKIVYDSDPAQLEGLINLIRKVGLDPLTVGYPYNNRQNLDKIMTTLHTEEFMTGVAMRILEERDWRDKELR